MFPREFDPAQPELMDRPQPVSRDLEIDLENLVGINRNFGSHRLIRWFLRRWFQPGARYRVLDLCTASGDIPRLMVDWARPLGVALEIDAVDYQPSTVEIARRRSAGYPEIAFREGDARAVPGGVCLMTAVLYREPMTKADARISVRRAFSHTEFAALAQRAGWQDFRRARFAVARQAVWMDKRPI